MARLGRRAVLAVILASAGCSKFKNYDGPRVTKIEVHKNARKMYLLHHKSILEEFDIQLGFTAEGPKQFEGDGKTPEGRYLIDRRNPNSAFYLSIGISYPNARDAAFAQAAGKKPGGDIFIHGGSARLGKRSADWTAGCIAVRDREMRHIYAMVENGTIIDIFP